MNNNLHIALIMQKMIDYSNGNTHDINHFMKVWTYAHTIGTLEQLDDETQLTLEIAAIVHDIACPLCRKKYGNTNGKKQEREGMALAAELLDGTGISELTKQRVVFIVGHHHTFSEVDGLDYQIMLEADYLVNADESHYSKANINNMLEHIYKTASGRQLLKSVYGL